MRGDVNLICDLTSGPLRQYSRMNAKKLIPISTVGIFVLFGYLPLI